MKMSVAVVYGNFHRPAEALHGVSSDRRGQSAEAMP